MQFTNDFYKYNNGYKYCSVCIDVFSRFLLCEPLLTKSSEEIIVGFRKIFKNNKPRIIVIDGESGVWSNKTQLFLKSNDITTILGGTNGACIAERVIRSIKEIMFKYFNEKKTNNWISVIKDLVDIYNNRWHRTLIMSPINARSPENFDYIFERVNGKIIINEGSKNCKFKIGDKVRK